MPFATGSFAGTLVVAVYLGAVALSLPASAATLLLARRLGVGQAAIAVALGAAGTLGIVAVGVGVLAGITPALAFLAVGLVALVGLWVVPVAVGAVVVRGFVGLVVDTALGFAVAGLPPAMIVSAVLFVAPGGPTGYNLTFLEGPVLWLGGSIFVVVVLFGPGVAGVGLARLVSRRRVPE